MDLNDLEHCGYCVKFGEGMKFQALMTDKGHATDYAARNHGVLYDVYLVKPVTAGNAAPQHGADSAALGALPLLGG